MAFPSWQQPANQCACTSGGFTDLCCEDQLDRDGDGFADCLMQEAAQQFACFPS